MLFLLSRDKLRSLISKINLGTVEVYTNNISPLTVMFHNMGYIYMWRIDDGTWVTCGELMATYTCGELMTVHGLHIYVVNKN